MNPANPEFKISRIFDAPRPLVWKAWTQPEMLAKWFGPKGCTSTAVKQDLRPGGVLHTRMEQNGTTIWGKLTYQEITPPSRLVWLHSFSDEGGVNLTRHPMSPNWPLELLTTVILEEQGNKTKLTLTWVPVNASDSERNTFAEALPNMNQGWGGSFDQLDVFLHQAAVA